MTKPMKQCVCVCVCVCACVRVRACARTHLCGSCLNLISYHYAFQQEYLFCVVGFEVSFVFRTEIPEQNFHIV